MALNVFQNTTLFVVRRSVLNVDISRIMSLHRYFKPLTPKDTLDSVPVAATIAELTAQDINEVSAQLENLGNRQGSKRKPYTIYDEHKRCEVAKYAISCSNKSAARKYGIPISTVRGFVSSYKELTLDNNPNETISKLP